MATLLQIRNLCIQSINLLRQAERTKADAIQAAERNQRQTISTLKQQQNDVTAWLRSANIRMQECRTASERRLHEYNLTGPGQSTPVRYNTNVSSNELAEQINSLFNQINIDLQEIDRDGQKLINERRKWWKFW